MKWFTLTTAMLVCCAGTSTADAGLFDFLDRDHGRCCDPAPKCCKPAPKPKCHKPAPKCCKPMPRKCCKPKPRKCCKPMPRKCCKPKPRKCCKPRRRCCEDRCCDDGHHGLFSGLFN